MSFFFFTSENVSHFDILQHQYSKLSILSAWYFHNSLWENYGTFYHKTRTLVVFYDIQHFPNQILGCDVISLKRSAT